MNKHLVLLPVVLSFGCAASGDLSARDTVTDSAGVAIASSPAENRALGWEFTEVLRLGGDETGAGSFTTASHSTVATNGADRIYVYDRDASAVHAFADDGAHVATMGGPGSGPGEISFSLQLVDVGPGRVGIYDFGKSALLQWDATGTLVDEGPLPYGVGTQSDVALRGDTLFLATTDDDSLRTLATLERITPTDTLVLGSLETAPRAMIEFSCFTARVPPLFTPTLVWSTQGPWLAVARQDRYVIDIYHNGVLVRSLRRPIQGRSTTAEDVTRQHPEGMEVRFGSGPGCTIPIDEIREKRGMADVLPVIQDVAFGPNGTLWVQRHTFPGGSPEVDVFAIEGGYLGTDVGRGLPLGELAGDRVLFPVADSSTGVTQLGIYSTDRDGHR